MKKIQVSTVKQTADVQVINLNAYIIAKAVRASVMLHNAFDHAIEEEEMPEINKDGSLTVDENGKQVFKKARLLDQHNFDIIEAAAAYDNAIAFIDELVAAFEEE